jgi:hypothetical protein
MAFLGSPTDRIFANNKKEANKTNKYINIL